ncbi:MAG: hypothetical protein ACYTF1_23545 [Planctomycetota bacterium]
MNPDLNIFEPQNQGFPDRRDRESGVILSGYAISSRIYVDNGSRVLILPVQEDGASAGSPPRALEGGHEGATEGKL